MVICMSFQALASDLQQSNRYQDDDTYNYKDTKISKSLLLKNLRHNVQSYIEYNGWDSYRVEEFKHAYYKYLKAIEEGRIYTNDFGNLWDTAGKLNNFDEDDYYYDKKGNRITGDEYSKLSPRKQKKYLPFYANRYMANFVDSIAKELAKHKNNSH